MHSKIQKAVCGFYSSLFLHFTKEYSNQVIAEIIISNPIRARISSIVGPPFLSKGIEYE